MSVQLFTARRVRINGQISNLLPDYRFDIARQVLELFLDVLGQ